MIRTKDRFYWSDALYLARAKNLLILRETGEDTQVYQCSCCSSFARFRSGSEKDHTGKWSRIKPYEQFQLQKKYDQPIQTDSLKEVPREKGKKKLYQCQICASHWWPHDGGWDHADDDAIDKRK